MRAKATELSLGIGHLRHHHHPLSSSGCSSDMWSCPSRHCTPSRTRTGDTLSYYNHNNHHYNYKGGGN